MSKPRANSRAGGPGPATILRPITARSGTGWTKTAKCNARSGSRRSTLTGMRNVHGGCFMSFADYCLFAIASSVLQGPGVTVSFSCEFLDAAREGELVECDGRNHPRRRLADLPPRRAEIWRTVAVHLSGTIKRVKWKQPRRRHRCHLTPTGPSRLARLCVAARAGVLLEFDLSADQDRPRLDSRRSPSSRRAR